MLQGHVFNVTCCLACAGSLLLAGLSAPAALLFSMLGLDKGAAQYAVRAALVRLPPPLPPVRQTVGNCTPMQKSKWCSAGPGLRIKPGAPALGCGAGV